MTKRRTTADLARWLAPLTSELPLQCNTLIGGPSILSSNDARIKNNTHAGRLHRTHVWSRRAKIRINFWEGQAGGRLVAELACTRFYTLHLAGRLGMGWDGGCGPARSR